MPEGWYLIRIRNFTARTLAEMDEWLIENATGQYARIGWRSGCATMVAVQFETALDAVFARLRWGD